MRYNEKPERNERIVKMRQEGSSYAEIAQALGISTQRVSQILYEKNAPRVDKVAIWSERLYQFIVEYKQTHDGNSPSVIEMIAAVSRNRSRLEAHLDYLEAAGRIKIKQIFGHQAAITVIGATWTPPQENQ